jgi:hypothetical protein
MSVVPTGKQISAVAESLRGLVGELDPGLVTTREAPGLWQGLEEVRRIAAGAQMLLAKRVDESEAPAKAGLRNGAEWIAARGGGSLRSAYDAVAASKRLAGLPEVGRALRAGLISTVQAAVIADACTVDPTVAGDLLELAGRASLGELRREALRVKAAADADPDKTQRRIRRERRLRWFLDQEGAWKLHGRGPAEAGAELATVLTPIVEDIFAAAREAGLREPREAYTWDGLLEMARMAWSYMHGGSLADAHDSSTAATAAETGDRNEDGGRVAAPRARRRRTAGVNPWCRMVIRVDHAALVRGRVEGDEVCEVAGVGSVSVSAARSLLGQALLDLVVTRGRDVANYTHLGRGQNAAQRIASLWSQPECQRLGCHRPVMEWDHREPFARNRVTEIGNMQGLCRPDHRLKTEHGWDLVEGTGRRPMVPPGDPRHPKNRGRRSRDGPGPRPAAA